MNAPAPYDMDIFWLKADRPPGWREEVRRLIVLNQAYHDSDPVAALAKAQAAAMMPRGAR